MTIKDAYLKAKARSDKKVLTECIDIGDSWAFDFRSHLLRSDPMLIGGIHYYTVNKKTGTIGTLSSNPDHMKLIWSGTPVNPITFGVIVPKVRAAKFPSRLELFLYRFLSK